MVFFAVWVWAAFAVVEGTTFVLAALAMSQVARALPKGAEGQYASTLHPFTRACNTATTTRGCSFATSNTADWVTPVSSLNWIWNRCRLCRCFSITTTVVAITPKCRARTSSYLHDSMLS